jgi:hypothetical protein
LATNLLKEHQNPEKAIEEAFLRILCRSPKSNELRILNTYFQEEKERLSKNPNAIMDLVNVGEATLNKDKINHQTAALMLLVSTLYNLEEAITKI